MGDINYYSKEALEKQAEIKNYTRKEENGVVKITYDIVDRGKAAAIGAVVGVFFAPALIWGPVLGAAIGHTTSHSHYFDAKDRELLGSHQNDAAEKLYNKGSKLFQEGQYTKSAEYNTNAYLTCSSGYQNEHMFKNNKDKAKTEVDAINLNSQGDGLFSQGKYTEAQKKYQEAYYKSQVSKEYNKYRANRDRAKAEVEAINLNSKGDGLFSQEKYGEALNKYQEAHDKSQVTKEKNIYKINKEKTQTIIDKLSIIDVLWNKAWNDEENGRSAEAEKSFQQILIECKYSLKLFPDNLRLKEHETLVSLKIEGNELFNQGLKLELNGINLLKEAQELKEKRKYKSTNIKFKEAKDKFIDAQKVFAKGIPNDQRFISCIEIVQDQINQIIQSIKITEQHALIRGFENLDVDISNVHGLNDDFCETESIGEDKYHEQI